MENICMKQSDIYVCRFFGIKKESGRICFAVFVLAQLVISAQTLLAFIDIYAKAS